MKTYLLAELENKREIWKLKHETSNGTNGTGNRSSRNSKSSKTPDGTSNRTSRTLSPNQQRVFSYLEQQVELRGEVPSFSEVMEKLELPQSTASRLRNEWIERTK